MGTSIDSPRLMYASEALYEGDEDAQSEAWNRTYLTAPGSKRMFTPAISAPERMNKDCQAEGDTLTCGDRKLVDLRKKVL